MIDILQFLAGAFGALGIALMVLWGGAYLADRWEREAGE